MRWDGELVDFVTVARRSTDELLLGAVTPAVSGDALMAAIAHAGHEGQLAPDRRFFVALLAGGSFSRSAQLAGLRRGDAKHLLMTVGEACSAFARATATTAMRRRSHRAFQGKDRCGTPARRDPAAADAVWTHVWQDESTAFVGAWAIGPVDAAADDRGPVAPAWLQALPAGLARQARAHAAVVGVLLTHHNYCRCAGGRPVTPAMRVDRADRPWSVDEMLTAAGGEHR